VPGVLIRIAVIEPAKVAATYIVASTAIAWTGVMVKVKGRRRAAPVVAPSPGKTPITIPRTVIQAININRYGSSITEPIAETASYIMNHPYP
jgi:hypothetical protein